MTFFGLAVIFGGITADDPIITAMGVVIALVGLFVFIVRQTTRDEDLGDAGVSAGIVSMKAPASLVALVVGVFLILVGQGALTLDTAELVGDDSGEAASEVTVPVATTSTTVATTSTTAVATTQGFGPPVTDPNPTVPEEPIELPMTGALTQGLFAFGAVALSGGRWIVRAS